MVFSPNNPSMPCVTAWLYRSAPSTMYPLAISVTTILEHPMTRVRIPPRQHNARKNPYIRKKSVSFKWLCQRLHSNTNNAVTPAILTTLTLTAGKLRFPNRIFTCPSSHFRQADLLIPITALHHGHFFVRAGGFVSAFGTVNTFPHLHLPRLPTSSARTRYFFPHVQVTLIRPVSFTVIAPTPVCPSHLKLLPPTA